MPKQEFTLSHKAYRSWLEEEKGMKDRRTALSTYYGSVANGASTGVFGICVKNDICSPDDDLIDMDIVGYFDVLKQFFFLNEDDADISKSAFSSAGSHARCLLEYKKTRLYEEYKLLGNTGGNELAFDVVNTLTDTFGFSDKYYALEAIRDELLNSDILPGIKSKDDIKRDFGLPNDGNFADSNYLLIAAVVHNEWAYKRSALLKRMKKIIISQVKKVHADCLEPKKEMILTFRELTQKLAHGLILRSGSDKGFADSAVQAHLYRMNSAVSCGFESFDEDKLCELICELIVMALANKGRAFSQSFVLYPNSRKDRSLIAFLKPLLVKINRDELKKDVLYNSEYVQRLLNVKAIYPSYDGTDIEIAHNLRLEVCLDDKGMVVANEVWSDTEELELLTAMLRTVYTGMKAKLEMKYTDDSLFELSDEIRVLLGARFDVRQESKEGHDVQALLVSIFVLCYLHSVYIKDASAEEKLRSTEQLIYMYGKHKNDVIIAVKDFSEIACKLVSDYGNNDVHLIVAEWQLDAAEAFFASALADGEDGADPEHTKSLLNRAIIAAREALRISDGCDGARALDSACVLARSHALLASMLEGGYEQNGITDYYFAEHIRPLSEALETAKKLKAVCPERYVQAEAFCKERFQKLAKYESEYAQKKSTLDDEVSARIASTELRDSLRDMKTPGLLIYIPREIDRTQLFRSFYVADFDSAVAAHRNFRQSDIQLPIMNLLLSAKPVILSPNQIIDHDILLGLAAFPGYLDFYKRGYINLSFYNTPNLCKYAAKQLERPDFEWSSSLSFLNLCDKPDVDAKIMACRNHIAAYLRGDSALESAYFTAIHKGGSEYQQIKQYKDNLRLIDENLPAVSRTLYYQHNENIGNSDILLTEWLDNMYLQKRDGFSLQRTVHDVISNTLPDVKAKGYKRTHYKTKLDRILHGNLDGLVMNKIQENEILSMVDSSERASALDPMYDALHDCYNYVVGSLISADQFRNYSSDSAVPTLDEQFVSLKNNRFESKRHDSYISISETGTAIRFDDLSEYLSGIRAIIDESKNIIELSSRLNNNPDTRSELGYEIGENGVQIAHASFELTTREKLNMDCEGDGMALKRISFETQEK